GGRSSDCIAPAGKSEACSLTQLRITRRSRALNSPLPLLDMRSDDPLSAPGVGGATAAEFVSELDGGVAPPGAAETLVAVSLVLNPSNASEAPVASRFPVAAAP